LLQTTAEAALAPLTGQVTAHTLTPAALSLAQAFLSGTALAPLKAGLLLVLALLTAAGAAAAALLVLGQAEADAPPPAATLTIDEQVLALAFSPDGKKLVTAGARHLLPGQFKVWDVATRENLVRVRGLRGIRAVAYAPDARSVATGVFGGELTLRDPTDGHEQAMASEHAVGVNSLAYSADGQLLVTAGLDHVVKLWEVKGLREKQAFRGHTDMVFSVAFFRHGRAVVSGGQDKTARIWDLGTGQERFTLAGHREPVEAVAVSPDDRVVATASWDRTVKFWDADTGQEIAALPTQESSVLAIAFSPGGKQLASGTHGGKVRLWDVETRAAVADLGGHTSAVWALAFSGDGTLLASGSSDRTAKLWDVAGRKEVATLMTGEGPAPAADAAPAVPGKEARPRAPAEPANLARPGPEQAAGPRPGRRVWLPAAVLFLLAVALCALVLYGARRAQLEQRDAPSDGLFRFPCAGCGKPLKARPGQAGKNVRCPHCHERISLPAPAADARPAPGPSRFALSRRGRVLSGLALLSLALVAGLVFVLHRPPRPPLVNVVVGYEFRPDVEESGFYPQRYDKQGQPYRWTDGAARLTIPIDPQDPPRAVRLRLLPWRPAQAELAQVRITVNGRELFNGRVSRDFWERTLDLGGIDLGSAVEVEIGGNTFIPKDFDPPSDHRPYGVEVRAVELQGR
jgi:hypothetical protein